MDFIIVYETETKITPKNSIQQVPITVDQFATRKLAWKYFYNETKRNALMSINVLNL